MVTKQIAKRNEGGLEALLQSPSVKKRFAGILKKKSAGFISSIVSAVKGNNSLALCEPGTVVSAAFIAASLDLPINPNLGFAYIIPYSNRAQFQMGWKGFVQLALRTGEYKTINASCVYEGELKNFNWITGDIEFDHDARESDKVIGYVAYFKLLIGFEKYYYMSKADVERHGKKYSKSYASKAGQWYLNFDAMALKTVLKLLLSKYGILSIQMQDAIKGDQIIEGEYDDNPIKEPTGKPHVEIPQSTKKRTRKKEEPETEPIDVDPEPAEEGSGEPITADQVQSIHVLAGKLWGKDFQKEYKEKLFTWTGKDSSKKLTSEEADSVIGLIVSELNSNRKATGKWKK
jgi:recombination protein RecT